MNQGRAQVRIENVQVFGENLLALVQLRSSNVLLPEEECLPHAKAFEERYLHHLREEEVFALPLVQRGEVSLGLIEVRHTGA